MLRFLDAIPYTPLLLAALLLGLAPFTPMPHIVEKIGMLSRGELKAPIDILDLLLHAAPALILITKLIHDAVLGRFRG
jgi:hypothetical protein